MEDEMWTTNTDAGKRLSTKGGHSKNIDLALPQTVTDLEAPELAIHRRAGVHSQH